uniref:Pollen-specific leucine-rich repeat extensin-like protein 2 n=1 Tax=Cicer arietinum TaxID=3827 RepID=A0A1S3DZ89_CICAR|nr:pollen-specific leucine-rich repeat extensin-like protein 2 [Cicer arietinum]
MSKAKYIVEGGSSNKPPFFNGSDYYFWKNKMHLFLKSQDTWMWRIITDGDFIPRVDQDDSTSAAKKEADCTTDDKTKCSQLLIFFLKSLSKTLSKPQQWARTKQSTRKNAYPCSPSSSSPSSDSIQRSPSPPPRPTPPHIFFDTTFSDYLSSSPENNPNPINTNLLSIVLPPLYTCPPPNLAQVPPHLLKPTIPTRHSMRVKSGIGTSTTSNVKPFYFIISDSKTGDSSDTPLHTTATEKAKTQPITPSKYFFSSEPSQSTPPNQKRRLINEIFSSLPKPYQPSSQSKKPTPNSMKTKTTMTIAQFLSRNKLRNPQTNNAPKQNLKLTKPASLEHSPFPQCSPALTPERSPNQERPLVRIPSSSPQQELSPHQERSHARPSSTSHPQEHSPIP